jgi:nucleotide-binding universal stress UspA family protein
VLVHVLHVPPVPRYLEGRYPSTDRLIDTAKRGAEARLRDLSQSIATGLVWPEVRVGTPDQVIVSVAAEYSAGIIAVGRSAPRSGVWARLGTTAQRVLRASSVPVLVAAELPRREPAHVLVAVDESDMTSAVLRWGQLLAARFSAVATAVHVVTVPVFVGASVASAGGGSFADARDVQEAERWLVQRLEDSVVRGMTPTVVAGPVRPADAILEEATHRRAELIVMGSRGAGGVRRFLVGSVAEAILESAPCPVLVVPPEAATVSSEIVETESPGLPQEAARRAGRPFDPVADASIESFPASDSPSWTGLRAGPPR